MSSGSGNNEGGPKPPPDGNKDGGKNDSGQQYQRYKNKNSNDRSIIKPPKFVGTCSEMQGHVFDCYQSKTKQVDEFQKTMEVLKTYIGGHFGSRVSKSISESVVWGQCSDTMQTRLKEMNGFGDAEEGQDAISLIRLIKNVTFNYKTHQNPIVAMHCTKLEFYRFNQGRQQTVQDYFESFNNMLDVNETVGSNVGTDTGLVRQILEDQEIDINNATPEETAEASVVAKQRYCAIAMLYGADKTRFGGLLEELRNDYLMGVDKYPVSMNECFTLLNHWAKDPRNVPGVNTPL